MRTSGNVGVEKFSHAGANDDAVFRAAHDSAKGVRTWMADLKKK